MAKKKSKKTKAAEPTTDKQKTKLSTKAYEAEIYKLHAELVNLQYWVKEKGHRVIVVFEGRDAAGKGGVIKRITERVSPRIFRVVALPTPTEREKTQWYPQRYVPHFPAAGEIVLFDRSWYNRAGVERVMKFCTKDEYKRFMLYAPEFERAMVDSGIQLIKYWFDVGMDEQERRLQRRIDDPRKVWKLSPMDVESFNRWYDYSRARDDMIAATSTEPCPLARGSCGRQEACAAQLHFALPEPDPLQEAAPREGRTRQARLEGQVRRRGGHGEASISSRRSI